MRIRRSYFATLVTSFILMGGVLAQEGNIFLQFLAFPKKMLPEPIELVVGEGKTIEVDTPGNELSSAYKVSPLGLIVVGKTTVNEEGETVFQEYGKAKAISASKQIILLIRKGKEDSDGFVVIPINAEQTNFGGGRFLFINASSLNVGGVIGDSKFALKPGQQKLVTPKPDHPDGICQVTLSYQREDKWKTFKDTRWSANESYRTLVFFHQDPETGRLGVSPVVDILPFKPKGGE
jgi:hypothetical protein